MRQRVVWWDDVVIDAYCEHNTSLEISFNKVIRDVFLKINDRPFQNFRAFQKFSVKPVNNIFKFETDVGVFGRNIPAKVFLSIPLLGWGSECQQLLFKSIVGLAHVLDTRHFVVFAAGFHQMIKVKDIIELRSWTLVTASSYQNIEKLHGIVLLHLRFIQRIHFAVGASA